MPVNSSDEAFCQVVDGVVQSIKLITWDASERVARYAFHYAQSTGRNRVTAVHKANIMFVLFRRSLPQAVCSLLDDRKMSDGMFLSACRQVAKDFPGITYDEDLLDRACLQVGVITFEIHCILIGCRSSKTRNLLLTVSW